MARPKPTLQTIDRNAIFQKPRAAAILTGISQKAIYQGCKDGTIPAIKRGDWLINMPLWLSQLDIESKGGAAQA